MSFRNLHLAGEERGIGALKLVAQLDGERNRTGVSAALRFLNLPAAALSFPLVTFLDVAGVAIKLYPRTSRQRVLHVKLTAARDWTIHTKPHLRHPTPNVVVAFVDVESERCDLERVFGQGWLVVAGGRINNGSCCDKQECEDKSKGKSEFIHRRPPEFDWNWANRRKFTTEPDCSLRYSSTE